MKQGLCFLLGLILLFASCQTNGSLDIVNPPAYLLCGTKYQFVAVSSHRFLCPLSWDARYGSIDGQGLYQAPDFPCQEVVGVTALGVRKEVTFPVVQGLTGEVFPSETVALSPVFRVLVDVPSLVALREVPFGFAVQGNFAVTLNGIVLRKGSCNKVEEMLLSLSLEEGENLLLVFLEGREVFRKRILCDTTPPAISLSRATVTPEGIRLSGTASEEVAFEVVKGGGFHREWEILVPWKGVREVLFRDRVGNVLKEAFSAEKDVSFEITGPSRVKVGQQASFTVHCSYRGVPLEGEVFCGNEKITLEEGKGNLVMTFAQEGRISLTLHLGSMEREFSFEVFTPSVASLVVTSGVPEEQVAGIPLVVEGIVEDAAGDPCPRREVCGEITSGSSSVQLCTVSDASGRWVLAFTGLTGFGRRTLRLWSEGKKWEKELHLVSGQPASLLRVEPGPVLRPVAGSREHSFRVRALNSQGVLVSGVKVEWVWKIGDAVFPVPPEDLEVNERTGSSGECSGTIVMPRKVGTYTLEARCPFWDVPPVSWEITVLPTIPGYFEDLSCLPSRGKVGEPLFFTVSVRDIFGNPCPEWTVNVYRRGENGALVKEQSVSTSAEGKASFSLTPKREGVFIVEAWVYRTNLSLTWSIPVDP